MKRFDEKFHYCEPLELAMIELFGKDSKWDDMAGGFQNARVVREALLAATAKIRKHLDNSITSDERLRLTTSLILGGLEGEVRDLRDESNNELEIIALLLELVVTLLGFDWQSGKPNRHVIYYQTAEQEALDDARRHPIASNLAGVLESQKRSEIACRLYDEGLRVAQIASIMKLPEPAVKSFLVRAG